MPETTHAGVDMRVRDQAMRRSVKGIGQRQKCEQ